MRWSTKSPRNKFRKSITKNMRSESKIENEQSDSSITNGLLELSPETQKKIQLFQQTSRQTIPLKLKFNDSVPVDYSSLQSPYCPLAEPGLATT